jgi:transposase
MLHNEARELLVKAYEKHPVAKDIAEAFSISVSGVYRLVRQKARTGSVALRVNQRGRKKLLSEDDIRNIKAQIEAHNDITIEEIREALNLKASYSTVERAVNGLGYTVKKKSLHASERDRARCTGKTYSVERTISRG